MVPMRMVATDLDGTIVRDEHVVSDRTLAALRACDRAGIPVVLVTGRPPRWVQVVADRLDLPGEAVCANGALVLHRDGSVSRVQALEHDTVREVVASLRAHWPAAGVALETSRGFLRETGYRATWDRVDPRADDVLDLLGQEGPDGPHEVVKVLVRVEGGDADEMLVVAREVLHERAVPTHSGAASGLLEIAALGVSKAVALAEVADGHGVQARDVVAFGDMPNDVPMLTWAGRGFAMADGHPDALAAADLVAPPLREDGVAQVLEALLAGDDPPVVRRPA
jgi:HAD superfamily hydrolase (TIGR01484 family)